MRRGATGIALLAVVAASCSSSTGNGSSGSTGAISVVSLGDSIASGEGIAYGYRYDPAPPPHWAGGTTSPTWVGPYQGCHVTNQAYGDVVAASLHARFTTFACTGSTYQNGIVGPRTTVVNGSQVTLRPPQFGDWISRRDLNAAYDQARPDLVLVTLGADDVHFVDIVESCVVASLLDPSVCTAAKPGPTIERDYYQTLPILTQDLRALALDIRARGRAARPPKVPAIVFTTYANPLPVPGADISVGACPDAAHLNASQIAFMSGLLTGVGSVIGKALSGIPGVSVADIASALAGHRLCSADPWAYGPSILLSSPQSTAPFHPTPSGQRAIAAIVLRSVPGSLGKR